MAADRKAWKDKTAEKVEKEENVIASKHLLLSLVVDKKNGLPLNLAKWQRGVHQWVSKVDLHFAMGMNGSVQIPEDNLARVRAHTIAESVVKTERSESSKIDLTASSSSKSAQPAETAKEKIAKLFEKAAKRTAEHEADEAKKSGRKTFKKVLFADTETVFTDSEASELEALGMVLSEVKLQGDQYKSGKWFCRAEDKKKRERRYFGWREIESTLGQLDKTLWEHIAIGDMRALTQLVMDTFGKDQIAEQDRLWHARLDSLRLEKDKGFEVFAAEVKKLVGDAEEVGIKYSALNLRHRVQDAISKGGNKIFNAEWVEAERVEARLLRKDPKAGALTVLEMLDEMKTGIASAQRSERYMGGSESIKKTVAEELEKQIKKVSGQPGTLFPAKAEDSETKKLLSMCSKFQNDKCFNTACKFSHTKLSLEDKEKLRELLKKRFEARGGKTGGGASPTGAGAGGAQERAKVTCYNCQEQGHIASACSKPIKCNKCGKNGHKAVDCTEKGGVARGVGKKAIKKALVDLLQECGEDFTLEELLEVKKAAKAPGGPASGEDSE